MYLYLYTLVPQQELLQEPQRLAAASSPQLLQALPLRRRQLPCRRRPSNSTLQQCSRHSDSRVGCATANARRRRVASASRATANALRSASSSATRASFAPTSRTAQWPRLPCRGSDSWSCSSPSKCRPLRSRSPSAQLNRVAL